jgi:hypothetical protein
VQQKSWHLDAAVDVRPVLHFRVAAAQAMLVMSVFREATAEQRKRGRDKLRVLQERVRGETLSCRASAVVEQHYSAYNSGNIRRCCTLHSTNLMRPMA